MTLAMTGASFWIVVGALAVLSAASTWATAWLVWRRAMDAHPQEHAFRAIARRVGLSRAEREVVRGLAAEMDVPPVVLLLSPATLTQAAPGAGAMGARLAERAAEWSGGYGGA